MISRLVGQAACGAAWLRPVKAGLVPGGVLNDTAAVGDWRGGGTPDGGLPKRRIWGQSTLFPAALELPDTA